MSPPTPNARREAARRQQRRRLVVVIVVAALVVALAILIAVLSTEETSSAVTVEEVAGSPTISGEPLPPPPSEDPTTDPAIGTQAPVVEGTGLEGEPVTIGDAGTGELVMFVASWCPACQEELPHVVDWMAGGGVPEDVELTAVVTSLDDARPNWPPQDWLDEEGFTGEVLVDDADGSVADAYGLTGTPYWVVLDSDGEIVIRFAGVLDSSQLDDLAQLATQDASPAA